MTDELDPRDRAIARLLADTPVPEDQAGLNRALTAYRRSRAGRRGRRRASRHGLRVATIAAVSVVTGTFAAGYAAALPDPVQRAVHHIFGRVGVPAPQPRHQMASLRPHALRRAAAPVAAASGHGLPVHRPAVPGPAAAKSQFTVTLTPAQVSATPGSRAALTARLTAGGTPLANGRLCLQARRRSETFGTCTPITGLTDSTGRVTFMVSVSRTAGQWQQYRVAFNENPRSADRRVWRSAPVTVIASGGTPTSLALRAAKSTIVSGGSDTLTALLEARGRPLSGQQLCLQTRAYGGRFGSCVPIRARTDRSGRVRITVTVSATSGRQQQYRVVFAAARPDANDYLASRSAVITVTAS